MMNKNIARNMWSSQGIINYPIQLHLVGRFHILLLNLFHTETRLTKWISLMWPGDMPIRERPKVLPHRHQAQKDSKKSTKLIYK